jgi:transcription antitermination factor NusG
LVPLFEGFLFAANFLEETRTLAQVPYYADYELRRHRHCFGILRTALQEQLKRQLTAIAMTSSAYSLQKMPAGTLVRVQSGPLEGFEGVVVQDNGQLRLVIEVLMLGTLAAVEINREEIAHASASK